MRGWRKTEMANGSNKIYKRILGTFGILIYITVFAVVCRNYFLANRLVDFEVPTQASCNSGDKQLMIDIKIRNNKIETISSKNDEFITYHLLDESNKLIAYDNIRTQIPDVEPGRTKDVVLHVDIPSVSGNYKVRIDIVKENAYWYEDKGNRPAEVKLFVK